MNNRYVKVGGIFTSGLLMGIWFMGESARYLMAAIVILIAIYIPHGNILQLFEEEKEE